MASVLEVLPQLLGRVFYALSEDGNGGWLSNLYAATVPDALSPLVVCSSFGQRWIDSGDHHVGSSVSAKLGMALEQLWRCAANAVAYTQAVLSC